MPDLIHLYSHGATLPVHFQQLLLQLMLTLPGLTSTILYADVALDSFRLNQPG